MLIIKYIRYKFMFIIVIIGVLCMKRNFLSNIYFLLINLRVLVNVTKLCYYNKFKADSFY